MGKKNNKQVPSEKLKREHSISIRMNEREYRVFIKYCRQHKIKNKAKFIRETLFKKILEDWDKNYPKLF